MVRVRSADGPSGFCRCLNGNSVVSSVKQTSFLESQGLRDLPAPICRSGNSSVFPPLYSTSFAKSFAHIVTFPSIPDASNGCERQCSCAWRTYHSTISILANVTFVAQALLCSLTDLPCRREYPNASIGESWGI